MILKLDFFFYKELCFLLFFQGRKEFVSLSLLPFTINY